MPLTHYFTLASRASSRLSLTIFPSPHAACRDARRDAIAKEAKSRKAGMDRAKRAAGIDDGVDVDEEKEKEDNDGITPKGGVAGASATDAALSVAQAAAQAAKALQLQLGNAKGAAAA